MLNVIFYQFAKKINSTARPGTGGLSYSCELKQGTSLMNPVLLLHYADMSDNHILYNYCYIEDFKRYYFVADRFWRDGIWEITLNCDVLASFRDEIMQSQQYIKRAYHTTDGEIACDFDIPDGVYNDRARVTIDTSTASRPWGTPEAPSISSGWFVLGIVSDSPDWRFGLVKYFVLNASQMQVFNSKFLDRFRWDQPVTGFEDVLTDIAKGTNSITKYFVSCKWFPTTPPCVGEGTPGDIYDKMKIGGWNYDIPHYVLSSATGFNYVESQIILPKHPNGVSVRESYRGDYFNASPWTRYNLDIRPLGNFDIDPAPFVEADNLYIKIKIDYISGAATVFLSPTNGSEGFTKIYRATLGVEIPLIANGQNNNVLPAASNVISDLSNTFSNNLTRKEASEGLSLTGAGYAGAIMTAADIGLNVAKVSLFPSNAVLNMAASISDFWEPIRLTAFFTIPASRAAIRMGFPLEKLDYLNNYTGFISIINPVISINGTQAESNQILQFMTGGFYIE